MFEDLKIRKEQKRIAELNIPGSVTKKLLEEMIELEIELRQFLHIMGARANDIDNYINHVGNIQKEIQDVKNTLRQVERLFNQTSLQKSWTKTCKKKIIKQTRRFIENYEQKNL